MLGRVASQSMEEQPHGSDRKEKVTEEGPGGGMAHLPGGLETHTAPFPGWSEPLRRLHMWLVSQPRGALLH